MKRYIRMIITRGLMGIAIGETISQIFYLVMALQSETVTVSSDMIIKQFIYAGAIGFYCTCISVIFDIEEWSLLKQTLVHFIAMLPYFPVAYFAGWMPLMWWARMLFILFFIAVYMLIWLFVRNYWIKRAKELNEGLSRLNVR